MAVENTDWSDPEIDDPTFGVAIEKILGWGIAGPGDSPGLSTRHERTTAFRACPHADGNRLLHDLMKVELAGNA